MEKGKGKAVKKRRRKEFNNPDAPLIKGKGIELCLFESTDVAISLGKSPQKQANPSLRAKKEKLSPKANKKNRKAFIYPIPVSKLELQTPYLKLKYAGYITLRGVA